MLNDLHIYNYRLFREFEVQGFRRINAFIGKNNVGKTSLLEALHLLHGSGNPRLLMSKNIIRDIEFDKRRVDVAIDVLWKSLFGELRIGAPILINGTHGQRGSLRLEVFLREEETSQLSLDQIDLARFRSGIGLFRNTSVVLRYKEGDKEPIESCIKEDGNSSLQIKDKSDNKSPFQVMLIAPNSSNQHTDAIHFSALRQYKMARNITGLLRSFEPKIEGIEENSSSGVPGIWVDIGLRELVPLPVIGNGIVQVLRILIAILSCPNGIVLIDEIENGLHHSILPNLWKAVNKASKKFNVQVVSTCHSYECVSAMLGSVEDEDFYVYRLQRQNDGPLIECIRIEPQVLQTAIEYRMEIR